MGRNDVRERRKEGKNGKRENRERNKNINC